MTQQAEAFEVKGYWWLPETPDEKIAGILTFDKAGGASLTLIGALQSLFDLAQPEHHEDGSSEIAITQSLLDSAGTYPRINGEAEGAAYSLEDCFVTQGRNRLFGQALETIRVGAIVKGASFEAGEALEAEALWLSLDHIEAWMNVGAFNEGHHPTTPDEADGDKHYKFTLEAFEKGSEKAVLSNGFTIGLWHRLGTEGDSLSHRGIRQYHWFSARHASLIPLRDLLEIASDIQDLVSIAAGEAAGFKRVSFRRQDIRRKSLTEDYGELPIEYIADWNVSSERSTSLHPGELFFSYSDIGGIDGVRDWLEVASKYRSELGRVMSSKYAKSMFVSDRLLNRAAALESFHKRATSVKKADFIDRIRWCVTRAGSQFLEIVGQDPEPWLETVKDERNDVAHHLGRSGAENPSEMYFLAESLYWLFVICMLREIGASEEVFDRIVKHQDVGWIAPKVQAAVQTAQALKAARIAASAGSQATSNPTK